MIPGCRERHRHVLKQKSRSAVLEPLDCSWKWAYCERIGWEGDQALLQGSISVERGGEVCPQGQLPRSQSSPGVEERQQVTEQVCAVIRIISHSLHLRETLVNSSQHASIAGTKCQSIWEASCKLTTAALETVVAEPERCNLSCRSTFSTLLGRDTSKPLT